MEKLLISLPHFHEAYLTEHLNLTERCHRKKITEKSVLNYFIVSSELSNDIIVMEIDEGKSFNLLKSMAFKEKTKVTRIDNFTVTIEMKIKAITKYKIQAERKWVLTHHRIGKFREKNKQ